jgi:uncharacterized membrane protein HdeD (DUF308 family)
MSDVASQVSESGGFPEKVREGVWVLVLIQGILALIIGVLLIASPGVTALALVQVLAWYWIFSGAISIISLVHDRTLWGLKIGLGMLNIVTGLIIIGAPLFSTAVLIAFYVIFLGVSGVLHGGVEIYRAVKGSGWGMGLLGVLNIVLGLLILMNLGGAIVVAPFVFGWVALFFGIAAIVSSFTLKKALKAA